MNQKLEKISATNLANLALDETCLKCWKLKSLCGFKAPFSSFPKIFNELDSTQKSFTESYLKEYQKLPPWLQEWDAKESVKVPGFGKWNAPHKSGVILSGVTDHILRLKDDRLLILDYKTSRPSGDKYFAQYKMQLSIYKFIAETSGLGEVAQLALVYYEPFTASTEWRDYSWADTNVNTNVPVGLKLNFRPYLLKIDALDIDPLVEKAKNLFEGEMPAEGCKECDRVMEWVNLVAQ